MAGVVVAGAAGRLGTRILEALRAAPDLRLVGALVRAGSPLEGQPASEAVAFTSDLDRALVPGAVVITVAPRSAALIHAERAARLGSPVLVATTGFDPAERTRIEAQAARIPVLIAPNLSPGVALLVELVRRAAAALPDYDLEVLELHHRKKRDAPSGTAWALAAAADEARGGDIERDAILARAGETGPRGAREVGMQSIRGGDIIGEHTVYLIGGSERLELVHRAAGREVFAEGAVKAARFLAAPGRRPGLYAMRDVLGLGGAG
jgi:4-hydroxy-tetrahydrodipicolinate reductase